MSDITAYDRFGHPVTKLPYEAQYTVELQNPEITDVQFDMLPPYEPLFKKGEEDMKRVTIPMPTKILRNGRATVVFFADDTKVVVKLPEGVEDNDYNAFCAAITKKMFGTNTRIKNCMEKITEIAPTEEEKKAAAEKARVDAIQKQQAEIERKVDRMARQIVLEEMAMLRAKEMMEGE